MVDMPAAMLSWCLGIPGNRMTSRMPISCSEPGSDPQGGNNPIAVVCLFSLPTSVRTQPQPPPVVRAAACALCRPLATQLRKGSASSLEMCY